MVNFEEFKNSLKKTLAGVFGVITMLSPLQSCQCYNHKFTYIEVAILSGFRLDKLTKDDISKLMREAEKMTQSSEKAYEKIEEATSKFAERTLSEPHRIGVPIPASVKAPPCYLFIGRFGNPHENSYVYKATRRLLHDTVEDIFVSFRVTSESNPYAWLSVFERGEKLVPMTSTIILKRLVDFIHQNMSLKDKETIFFGDKHDVECSILPTEKKHDDVGVELGYWGNLMLYRLHYLNTDGKRCDVRDFCKKHEIILGEKDLDCRRAVKEFKRLFKDIFAKISEIYEECGAAELEDDAVLADAKGSCCGNKVWYYYSEPAGPLMIAPPQFLLPAGPELPIIDEAEALLQELGQLEFPENMPVGPFGITDFSIVPINRINFS